MEAKPQKSNEELEREWWEKWRRVDFSWGGLAERNWVGWSVTPSNELVETASAPPGSRRATLQDYWRDQEAHLIEGDGKRWTRVHLPTFWADGTPTGKDEWGREERAALSAIIQEKLAAAGVTEFKGESSIYLEVEGPDRRAQLQGAVLINGSELKNHANPRLTLEQAAFIRFAMLRDLRIEGHASLAAVFFSRGVFMRDTFEGPADLSRMLCLGDFQAWSNSFGPDVAISSAVIRGNLIVGIDAFRGALNCDNTQFQDCDFSGVVFPRIASFISSEFYGVANFADAKFRGTANFNWSRFSGDAAFDAAKFDASCLFAGVECGGDIRFESAIFVDGVHLSSVAVTGGLLFRNARILGMLQLAGGSVGGKSSFRAVSFIDGDNEGGLDFRGSTFKEILNFRDAVFPTRPENVSAAFAACRVRDLVDFRGAGMHWIAALDDAIFEDKVLLDDPSETQARREFRNFLRGVGRTADEETARQVEAAKRERQDIVDIDHRMAVDLAEMEKRKPPRKGIPKPITAEERENWRWEVYEKRLKELEGGCRAIKVVMGRERDEVLEQRYYRFQLMARRRQKCVPFWEKFFSSLYALFSDYGASMARPFVAMFCVVLAFAGVFWAWSKSVVSGAGPAPLSAWFDGSLRFDPEFFEALRYSASRLLPIGAFGGDTNRWPWLHRLLEEQGAATGFWVRAVASLESVFALVLVFLFALAVRRRFQIS